MHGSLRGSRWTPAIRQDQGLPLKFGIAGACGWLVNTGVLALLYGLLHLPLVGSSLAAVELSIVTDYLLNDHCTFGWRRPSWRLLAKGNLASCSVLAVTPTVLWLLVHSGLQFLVANLIAVAAGIAMNVTTITLWVWWFSTAGRHL